MGWPNLYHVIVSICHYRYVTQSLFFWSIQSKNCKSYGFFVSRSKQWERNLNKWTSMTRHEILFNNGFQFEQQINTCIKLIGLSTIKGWQLHAFSPSAIVYCYLEFKLRYLKNLKLFSIRVKELSEPIVLWRKGDGF